MTLEGEVMNPNDLLNQSLERITKAGIPTPYQSGAISQAIQEFRNLESLVKSGKLSQKDYVSIGEKIQEKVTPIGNQGTQGKSPSSAVNAAGWYDIQNNFRDLKIYKNANELLGRDITPSEFAQIAPSFGNGSQREVEAGRAQLAQYAEAQKNTPEALDAKYAASAGQYGGKVNDIFQRLASRGATKQELDHFGKMLASGEVDEYTLGQFVNQLPEVTASRDLQERQNLNSELTKYDQEFFNKGKENILSRYAQAGIQNSPSLDFALTNLMGDIQKQRTAYLAGLSREDYARGRDLNREDYRITQDRLFGSQDYGRNRTDALSDLYRKRAYDVSDYRTQQDDLLNLLSSQPRQRRSRGTGQLIGGLLGAGVGAMTRNPAAIGAGYQIGSGTGMYFD